MSTSIVPAGAVVVGVADSQDTQPLDWAADRAARERRPLVLVHATGSLGTTGTVWLTEPDAGASPVVQQLRSAGLAVLAEAKAHVAARHPDLSVVPVVRLADPREAILDAAEQADLVVVGSRGRGPLRSRLLGSVGIAVTERSPRPVVIVRPHHPGRVRRGVLVGVEVSEHSRATLEFAFQEAALHGWPLTVVHTYWHKDLESSAPTPVSRDEAEPEWRALSESISGLGEKYPDVRVDLQIVRGVVVAECLVAVAHDRHLVVVGRRTGHRGSVARSVIERCDTVVAVVPS